MSKNISQEELALLAGVERAYVGHIERGKKNPTILTLAKLAKVLNCEVYDLLQMTDITEAKIDNLSPGRKVQN